MTWNEKRERIIAATELGDANPRVAVDLLVDARNRAFNAEQNGQQLQAKLDALKAAHTWIKTSERVPEETCDVLGVVDGVVMLLNYADDEDAAAVANSATTAEVLATSAQIERRLRTYETADKDGTPLLGFKDWLQTLDDDRLSGWRITKIRHLGAAPLHRKPDKRVIIAACTIDLHIRLVAD